MRQGRYTIIFLGLMIAFFSISLRAQEQRFRVCVDELDTPPLLTQSAKVDHQPSGLLIDLMGHAINNLNLSLDVIRYPWQRCVAKFKSGDMDAIVGLVWQKEYEKWAVFPMQAGHPDENYRLWEANYSIFVTQDSDIQWDGVNFKGLDKGVSTPQGLFIEKSLKQLRAFSNQVYTPADGLRLVSLKHLDAYVMESAQGRALMKQYALEGQLKELEMPFVDTSWFVPVSSKWAAKNPELTQRFWHELQTARIKYGPNLLSNYAQSNLSLSTRY